MANDSPLLPKILNEIRQDGSIGLDRYMEICLADPEYGYYAAGAPIGASGDFTTAPEISQIFGELIGLWLAQAWLDQGAPSAFALVELGPGRGVLMSDALRAARAAPGFLDAAQLWMIESSTPLRRMQAERLASAGLKTPPRWAARLDEVPELPLFFVANEFFDALPIRQWVKRDGAWCERRVGAEGPKLTYIEAEPGKGRSAPESAAFAPEEAAGAPEGAVWETSELSVSIAADLGRRLAGPGGAGLIIDYGYSDADRRAAGWRDTFQAIRAHKFCDPFESPGAVDLTAHISFGDLARAAVGASSYGPIGQGVLLNRLGAPVRAAALAKASPARSPEIASALHRLTEPDAMGALFKALALTSVAEMPPPAFNLS